MFLIFNPFKFWYLMGKIAPVKPLITMKSADNYPMRNTLVLSKPLNISYIVEIISSKHLFVVIGLDKRITLVWERGIIVLLQWL